VWSAPAQRRRRVAFGKPRHAGPKARPIQGKGRWLLQIRGSRFKIRVNGSVRLLHFHTVKIGLDHAGSNPPVELTVGVPGIE
jgi:hypothetical protein